MSKNTFFFYRIPLVTASVTGLRLFSCFHFFLFLPLEQPFPFSSLCVLPLVDLSSTSFIVLNTLLSFSSSMSWIAFTILWLWFSSVISSIVFKILFFSLLVVLWVSPTSALITAAPLAMLWSGPSAFWDFSWCFLSDVFFLLPGTSCIFCYSNRFLIWLTTSFSSSPLPSATILIFKLWIWSLLWC